MFHFLSKHNLDIVSLGRKYCQKGILQKFNEQPLSCKFYENNFRRSFDLLQCRSVSFYPLKKQSLHNRFTSLQNCDFSRMASCGFKNRLSEEKSPYLLQHAHNPVDWYPWGEEAFQKARDENKMIFLSVGYSSCHWCHVMERESFENEDIGQVLNENFVSIKVDSEERPDVDRVYMTFVQATTGGGGWPMSVWLAPDLTPIIGGTYFPPDDRYYNRPGFKTILLNIVEQWNSNQSELQEKGARILTALQKRTKFEHQGQPIPDKETYERCFESLEAVYDREFGGFGKAPKFPQSSNFDFVLRYFAMNKDNENGRQALDMTVNTLKMMAKGGIHDHIAQGFHRYSTDDMWHVPHFEKMLYDQGQLVVSYLEAFQITRNKIFEDTARDILEYVSRDLSHPDGGFYSAEDADSYPTHDANEKKEGAFCVWTKEELTSLLTEKVVGKDHTTFADIFCWHYHVMEDGNVDPYQDPHDELKGKNVLVVKGNIQQTAAHQAVDIDIVEDVLEKCRKILFEERLKRPKPHLDNKMVAAWNGLMISGYSKAGQILGDNLYTERAVKAAEFLYTHMFLQDWGILLRSSYTTEDQNISQIESTIEGFADDYAFVIRGLLDLYEACHDQKWLEWAELLQEKQNELFWDKEGGAYFSSCDDDPFIVIRMKEDQDGAEPSANSVSAMNLLRLSAMLDRSEWLAMATKIFCVFHGRLTEVPRAVPELICALMVFHSTTKQIIVAGNPEADDTAAMLKSIHSKFLLNKVLLLADSNENSFLYRKLPQLKNLKMIDGKATVYVCENFTCSLPTNSTEDLIKQLSDI
ncbi:spermatogenesis-associated protein 20 [Patella vulgata]|uniref:spermatogenesis-associated protein 20 n=1 Tax=Patella vulgata TaxID=6465 RepID=UPI00217F3EE2|nr:spermatogenesis-associated protein 20 [Patella vulgata]